MTFVKTKHDIMINKDFKENVLIVNGLQIITYVWRPTQYLIQQIDLLITDAAFVFNDAYIYVTKELFAPVTRNTDQY